VDLIERVGSYVGLAAFLGLGVLALLYFSQARDVRRLRDWAGRAPERAAEISEATVRKRKPLRERMRNVHVPDPRYLALVAAGLIVLGGAAFGAVKLVGGGDNQSKAPAASKGGGKQADRGGGKNGQSKQVNVDPSQVTVAILNGTTVQGLAAKVGEEVTAGGFTLGTIGNAAKIDQARSEVLYRKGQAQAARAVANRLGIQQTGPVDSVNAEIAGSFDVVVLVGSDRGG
jgi:LytR cell envelope-related transcriptional attenuator